MIEEGEMTTGQEIDSPLKCVMCEQEIPEDETPIRFVDQSGNVSLKALHSTGSCEWNYERAHTAWAEEQQATEEAKSPTSLG